MVRTMLQPGFNTISTLVQHSQCDHGNEAVPEPIKLAYLSLCSFLQVDKDIGVLGLD